MAGRIGSVQQSSDGKTYGFVIFDQADRACLYLGFPTWHQADTAAREARGLLVAALERFPVRLNRGSVPKSGEV